MVSTDTVLTGDTSKASGSETNRNTFLTFILHSTDQRGSRNQYARTSLVSEFSTCFTSEMVCSPMALIRILIVMINENKGKPPSYYNGGGSKDKEDSVDVKNLATLCFREHFLECDRQHSVFITDAIHHGIIRQVASCERKNEQRYPCGNTDAHPCHYDGQRRVRTLRSVTTSMSSRLHPARAISSSCVSESSTTML